MKRIVKKNQIIITALAIMIAIAGYLNYKDRKAEQAAAEVVEDGEGVTGDISAEDEYAQSGLAELALEEGDIPSLDAEEGEVPGEAVLTGGTVTAAFASEARISREQLRARNKEILMEVINNTNISESQKQAAIDSMIAMTDVSEREAAAEMLLSAKGFEDVVVSITDECVDVVVNMTEVDDAGRAQIEDIVKRKTGVSGENIVITPVAAQ